LSYSDVKYNRETYFLIWQATFKTHERVLELCWKNDLYLIANIPTRIKKYGSMQSLFAIDSVKIVHNYIEATLI